MITPTDSAYSDAYVVRNEYHRRFVFTKIPVPVWSWLDLNDATVSEQIFADMPRHYLCHVAPKRTMKEFFVERFNGREKKLITVEKDGNYELTIVCIAPPNGELAGQIRVSVEEKATASINMIFVGGKHLVSDIEMELVGDESCGEINTLYFATGDETVDINHIIRQRGKNTNAQMNVYGALGGNADKIFRGTLDFVKGCKGSKAAEREEVLLLSEGVRNRTVPLMLSNEDDVDGRHAASIGRLDEEKMFYLLSRGLDEAQAKRLLLDALFEPVLAKIEKEDIRAEIDEIFDAKIADCFNN